MNPYQTSTLSCQPTRRRSIGGTVAALFLLLCAAGCRPPAPSPPASSVREAAPVAPVKYTVGVSLLTKSHPFYQELEKSMRETAKDLGVDLKVMSAEFGMDAQTQQVENFITGGVDAILLCPADSDSVGGAIGKANDANIPVFTADIQANQGKVVSHIASDNVEGGKLAGEAMVKYLPSGGEVVIIDHPVVMSVRDRTEGFMSVMDRHPEFKVVARPPAEGQRSQAQAAMENQLQAHPDIKGVFAINDDSALGALAALKSANRDDIVVIGYDASEEARTEMRSGGSLKAEVVQHPDQIGRTAVQTVFDHLEGKTVPEVQPIDVGIVDADSLVRE